MRTFDKVKRTKERCARNYEYYHPSNSIDSKYFWKSVSQLYRADIPTQHNGPQSILKLKSFKLTDSFPLFQIKLEVCKEDIVKEFKDIMEVNMRSTLEMKRFGESLPYEACTLWQSHLQEGCTGAQFPPKKRTTLALNSVDCWKARIIQFWIHIRYGRGWLWVKTGWWKAFFNLHVARKVSASCGHRIPLQC